MAKKAVKSMRGIGESYDQVKQRYSICLTPTAHEKLKYFAQKKGVSLSELIEKIARTTIFLD
ncbi:hypothetical protein [Geminocystis sp. NIES-3709]|uniref:hypothetical protein n=1 Tax=Geminocystis sp. NIES-3709 TaxID=1617448 RepID=UPI0005FCD217|nr:hypothetical protein [Geminocystis sp. NIES-3709]BAQ67008.1 hypothetical protein GM3709_3773 [Geminocystis sp. NIES-3709]